MAAIKTEYQEYKDDDIDQTLLGIMDVAVCCRVLQGVAVCCRVLQSVPGCDRV